MSYNSAASQSQLNTSYQNGGGAFQYPAAPPPLEDKKPVEAEQQNILHGEALARDPFFERSAQWIVLGFISVFAFFLIGMNIFGQAPGQSFPLKGISDIFQFVGEGIGFFFCLRIALRLRRVSGQLRRRMHDLRQGQRNEVAAARLEAQAAERMVLAWTLLAIAVALYASGQAVWTSYDVRMPSAQVPFPGLYDIGFVGSYPFFLVGTLLLTRRNRAAVGRARLILDALTVIGASLALSWFFVLNPTIAGLSNAPSPGAAFLSIYFPAGDLFLVAIGAFLMFSPLANPQQQPVFLRLCLGLFFLAITDSLLGYFSLSPSGFNTGTLQDILWPLSMLFIGLAAIEYPLSIAREQEQAARLGNGALGIAPLTATSRLSQFSLTLQTVAPFVLALATAAALLTIVPNLGGRALLIQADLIALALFILVVIRQALTLLENNRLTLQMRGELAVSRRELRETRREANEATSALQDKQQIEQGIAALQLVHAEVARGNFAVRAPTNVGPLMPISQSFNLMLDRLVATTQRAASYEQLFAETQLLHQALDKISQGQVIWAQNQPLPQVSLPMRPVFQSLLYLQHAQQNVRQRVASTGNSLLRSVAKLKDALIALEDTLKIQQLAPTSIERGTFDRAMRTLEQIATQVKTLPASPAQSAQNIEDNQYHNGHNGQVYTTAGPQLEFPQTHQQQTWQAGNSRLHAKNGMNSTKRPYEV